jgi:hypothetical protein
MSYLEIHKDEVYGLLVNRTEVRLLCISSSHLSAAHIFLLSRSFSSLPCPPSLSFCSFSLHPPAPPAVPTDIDPLPRTQAPKLPVREHDVGRVSFLDLVASAIDLTTEFDAPFPCVRFLPASCALTSLYSLPLTLHRAAARAPAGELGRAPALQTMRYGRRAEPSASAEITRRGGWADDSVTRADADERLSPLLRGPAADIPGAFALRLCAPFCGSSRAAIALTRAPGEICRPRSGSIVARRLHVPENDQLKERCVRRLLYAVCPRRSCSPVRRDLRDRVVSSMTCAQRGQIGEDGATGTPLVGDVPMGERGAKAR